MLGKVCQDRELYVMLQVVPAVCRVFTPIACLPPPRVYPHASNARGGGKKGRERFTALLLCRALLPYTTMSAVPHVCLIARCQLLLDDTFVLLDNIFLVALA
jgi:hypothetical protein